MCVFPKAYAYNDNEPVYYPFAGEPPTDWDFTRFNPDFWRHFEQRVHDLQNLGIEADMAANYTQRMGIYEEWIKEKRYAGYAREIGKSIPNKVSPNMNFAGS